MCPERSHVEPPRRSVARVERAFVVVLPTKLWSCEIPARRGKTIGSSVSRWLNRHALMKLTPASACTFGAGTPAARGGADTAGTAETTATAAATTAARAAIRAAVTGRF